ncbi:hypothetical protein J4429_00110 [Candidatus Pacearchaeota archaeon]|nr:hypothetical protein [Candidatus Pacearchaeota archaeon]
MIKYLTKFLQKAYEFIHPVYTQNKKLAEFDKLKKSGRLEGMCASEVHKLFRITRISPEF